MPTELTDHVTLRDFKTDKGIKVTGYDIEVHPDSNTIIFDPTGRIKTETQNLTKASTTLFGVAKVGTNLDVTGGVVRVADAFVSRVGNLENKTTTLENNRVLRSGDTMTGNLTIDATTDVPLTLKTSVGRANYILGKDGDNTNDWYVGKPSYLNDNVALHSYKHNTSLSLEVDRIILSRDAYVGVDRLVKLPELNTTNSNVTALTTRTTNLENNRVLRSGDTMTGALKVTGVAIPIEHNFVRASACYSLWKDTNNVNWGYFGKGGTADDFTWASYVHGTNVILQADRVTFNKDTYTGTDRHVKLSELTTTNTNVTNLTTRVTTVEGNRVLKTGDTMTGALTINATNSDAPLSLQTATNRANYILAKDSAGANDWYIGRPSSTSSNITLNSYKHGTSLTLESSKITANKDVYVGSDRLVKLPELTTTNSNVTALTTRTTNLENSRALQTSLNATNARVTALETKGQANVSANVAGFSDFKVERRANVAVLNINSGTVFNTNRAYGLVLGTIPAGYRPTTAIYAPICSDEGFPNNLLISINSAGTVTLLSNNAGSANVYVGSIPFIIA